MRNLDSYLLLTSQGWEHVTNSSSHEEASDMLEDLRLHAYHYEYCIGEPKASQKYSVEALKQMGMVGIYRRGGKPSRRLLTPFFPVEPITYVPTPQPPQTPASPIRPHDPKPLEVAYAA